MEYLKNVGTVALVLFILGAIASLVYDIVFPYLYPDAARQRQERKERAAYEKEQRLRQQRDQEAAMRQYESDRLASKAAAERHHAECVAAREHLKQFYAAHSDVLADTCPPAMMTAFIRSEMGETLNAAQLWTICLKKIGELLPDVVKGQHGRARLQRIGQKIDAEIATCRKTIVRLKKSAEQLKQTGQDASFIEDEIAKQRDKLRKFETHKSQLTTLMMEGRT